MNLARVIEVDGAPMVFIFAKRHGTHQHHDIVGVTNLVTGESTCVRFAGEQMPKTDIAAVAWLTNKVQQIIGCPIEARHWTSKEGFTIDIMRVHRPGSKENPQPATTAA